jgi:hypothetical protein
MPRRPLRIFAIPLAKSLEANSKTPVVYWHVSQRRPPVKPRADEPADDDEGPSTILTRPDILAGLDYAQPKTWPHWATLKASETWLSLSNTQREGSILKTWKYKTWKNGERLMDRIDFEEWGLKNVDVGLDPWTGRGKKKHKKEEAKPSGDSHLREKPLIHPGDKPKVSFASKGLLRPLHLTHLASGTASTLSSAISYASLPSHPSHKPPDETHTLPSHLPNSISRPGTVPPSDRYHTRPAKPSAVLRPLESLESLESRSRRRVHPQARARRSY